MNIGCDYMKKLADIDLYHASKGGITGKISPINLEGNEKSWDFGRGFYMGTSEVQGKCLIVNSVKEKYVYTLKCKLSKISIDKVLVLQGLDWGFFVLYNRNKFQDITFYDVEKKKEIEIKVKNTRLYERYANIANNKDFVVGPIADDVLFNVSDSFAKNRITDFAFLSCIKAMNYGYQYVAKTERACDAISIKKVEILNNNDIKKYKNIAYNNSIKGTDFMNKILSNPFYRSGNLFTELIEQYENGKDITQIYDFPKTRLKFQSTEIMLKR